MSIELVNKESFDESVSSGDVLVDFYADWCGPCKMMLPLLEQIDNEIEDLKIIKVDVDKEQELSVKHHIRGIPALVLYRDGKIVSTVVGAQTKSALIELIEK